MNPLNSLISALQISQLGHQTAYSYYCKEEKLLVSGDTLFAGAIGRTDSQWGDYDKLIVAIMEKLMGLDGDVEVIPGHGPVTNIGYERTHNPFLQPFNEPDGDIDNEDELYIQGE